MAGDGHDFSTAENFDDYLVSLANGLAEAQEKLDLMGQDAQRPFRYQIPQLEFELKVQIHTEKTTDNGNKPGRKKSLFRVSQAETQEQITSANTIKGMVVAVPQQEIAPLYRLTLTSSEVEKNEHLVKAQIESISGEPQVEVPVEFNIDREETVLLNEEKGIDDQLKADSSLENGIVATDKDGVAAVKLKISENQKDGFCVAVRADALKNSTVLIIRKA